MRNGTHYSFMAYMQRMVQSYSSDNAELKTFTTQFDEALKAEFDLLSVSRKSFCTDDIHAADQMRDRLYSRFKHFVLGSAALPGLPEYEAALRIKKQLDASNVSSKWRLGQKTGILTKLIALMESDAFKEDVNTLGLKQTIVQLKEQNELVMAKLMERSDEQSALKEKALKNARKATDEAYYKLTTHLEVMCYFLKDEKLGRIIEACNVEIKRSIVEATYHKAKEDAPTDQAPDTNGQGQQQGGVTDVRPEPSPQPNGEMPQPNCQGGQTGTQGNPQANAPAPQPEDQQGNTAGNASGSSPGGTSGNNSPGDSPQSSSGNPKEPGGQDDKDQSSGIITDARPA